MRHRRSENSQFTTQNSLTNVWWLMTIFYLDVEPLSKYSTVTLHLVSPATRILNDNPGNGNATAAFDNLSACHFINNDNFVMISISSEIPLKKLTLLE